MEQIPLDHLFPILEIDMKSERPIKQSDSIQRPTQQFGLSEFHALQHSEWADVTPARPFWPHSHIYLCHFSKEKADNGAHQISQFETLALCSVAGR
jgi:hypothetical protein